MRNFRQGRVHLIPNEFNITQISSKDRQLTIMLLFEILNTVVFSLTSSILYVYTQRASDEAKTKEQQALDYFLLDLSLNLRFIQASLNFCSNCIVSKKFRKNIQSLIWKSIPPSLQRRLMNHWSTLSSNPQTMVTTIEAPVQHPITSI